MLKKCTKCLIDRSIDNFYISKNKNGYIRTSTCCKICHREIQKIYSKENRDRLLENNKKWREKNKEHIKAYYKKYSEENKEIILQKAAIFAKNNKNKVNFKNALRRAKKLKATPSWVDNIKLREIYLNCPKNHHVDHIIPLIHEKICGLHVPWNLQYLPASENLSKGNKFHV